MERLQAEREAYEDQYGPLEPMRVNILPPVFWGLFRLPINAVEYYREGENAAQYF